jgi:hypothetical protein
MFGVANDQERGQGPRNLGLEPENFQSEGYLCESFIPLPPHLCRSWLSIRHEQSQPWISPWRKKQFCVNLSLNLLTSPRHCSFVIGRANVGACDIRYALCLPRLLELINQTVNIFSEDRILFSDQRDTAFIEYASALCKLAIFCRLPRR